MLSPYYTGAYDSAVRKNCPRLRLLVRWVRGSSGCCSWRRGAWAKSHRDDAWSKSEIDRSWCYARLFRDLRRIRFGRIGASRSSSWRIWGILGTVVSQVPEQLCPASHGAEWTQTSFTFTTSLCLRGTPYSPRMSILQSHQTTTYPIIACATCLHYKKAAATMTVI